MEQKKTRLFLLGLGFWIILLNLNQIEWKGDYKEYLAQKLIEAVTPLGNYLQEENGENLITPLLSFVETQRDIEYAIESPVPQMEIDASWLLEDDSIPWFVEEESRQEELVTVTSDEMLPVKKQEISALLLQSPEYVRTNFFTVDPTTALDDRFLDYASLLKTDMSVRNKTPKVLIYHTHSQEGFLDSVAGEDETTIVGVGEYLSKLLSQQYGLEVIHHVAYYDLESRDYAYSLAAKDLEQVLEEHPDIDVMIDLHRDAVKEGNRLVTQVDGKTMARFMFFNGMSYTGQRGNLTSLANPYIQENLAFSFQLKLMAEEYYPGLTRKTYIKGYRYNMHYRPRSLLIELGGQTNTLEEAMNSCDILAWLIASVLLGEYPQGL